MHKCHGNSLILSWQLCYRTLATNTAKKNYRNIAICDLVLKPLSRRSQRYKRIANRINDLGDKSFSIFGFSN